MEDGARSPAEGAATTATVTVERTDLDLLLDGVQEWVYDDNPPHTYCPSCLWDSRKDRESPGGGLSHKEGCRWRAALERLRALL